MLQDAVHTFRSRPPISLGLAPLLLGATCIGIAPLLVRISEVGPSATGGYRLLLALPFMALWAARDQTPQPPLDRRFLILALGSGLAFAGDLAFWHWSMHYTTIANSVLFTNFAPFFVTLGAWWLLREKISGFLLAGLFIALGGGALLVSDSLHLSTNHLTGDLLALITALFYAAYLLCVKVLRTAHSTSRVMLYSGLASCPTLFLVAFASHEKILPSSPKGWLILVALALVGHLGGQCLISFALKVLPASFSSVALLWQPVVAAILAGWLLGEQLTQAALLGGLIVLAGIALASIPPRK